MKLSLIVVFALLAVASATNCPGDDCKKDAKTVIIGKVEGDEKPGCDCMKKAKIVKKLPDEEPKTCPCAEKKVMVPVVHTCDCCGQATCGCVSTCTSHPVIVEHHTCGCCGQATCGCVATCKAEEPVNADKPVTEEMKKAVHEAPAHKKVEVIQQQLRGNGKKL